MAFACLLCSWLPRGEALITFQNGSSLATQINLNAFYSRPENYDFTGTIVLVTFGAGSCQINNPAISQNPNGNIKK